jgi:hypothetical protein
MKTKAISWAAIAGSMLLCLGIPAFGQDVTIDFTGIANYNVQALGAYAGYYTGTVTANGSTVVENPGFICDDYNNEIFLPSESWQATATSFSSLASGGLSNTLFANTIGLAGYAAIANLASLMSTTPAGGQGDISAAIWYIGSVGSGNVVPWSSLDSTAKSYVNQMLTLYGSFGASSGDSAALAELSGSSLWIYTPTGSGITPANDPFPQEFIGNVAVLPVPEGGAALMYLLLAGISCFGAMFLNLRRQAAPQVAG